MLYISEDKLQFFQTINDNIQLNNTTTAYLFMFCFEEVRQFWFELCKEGDNQVININFVKLMSSLVPTYADN
jgi:hypothetical protein